MPNYSTVEVFTQDSLIEMLGLVRRIDKMLRERGPGLINRKMACPNCGPKFRKGYEKFKRELERSEKVRE